MIYVTDLIFFAMYLTFKEWARRLMDCNIAKLRMFRKYFYWLEYLLVILYQYLKPNATSTEKMVSFCMCIATCIAFDYLITKKKII